MKPDQSQDDLEMQFLEQSLREETPLEDLSYSVGQRFATENDQGKGEDMPTIAVTGVFSIDRSKSRFKGRFWAHVANVASIAAIVLLLASLWNSGYFSGDPEEANHAVGVVQDEQEVIEEHDETPEAVTVKTMADVRNLPDNTAWVVGRGEAITDDVLLELISAQPNLRRLELRQTWITERGVMELPRLGKLNSLSLASNDHIARDGWLSLSKNSKLVELDVSVFVGQTAALMIVGRENQRPPRRGVAPGKFMIPTIASLDRLRALDVSGTDLGNRELTELSASLGSRLIRLDISHTKVGEDGVRSLSRWNTLRDLKAIDICINQTSPLAPFVNLQQLTSLTVGANGMSSITYETDSLVALAKMPKLQTLALVSVNFKEGQLRAFANVDRSNSRSVKPLHKLELRHCFGVTDKDCQALGAIKGLVRLSMPSQKKLTRAGFLALTKGEAKYLDLRGSFPGIDSETLSTALKARPDMTIRVWKTRVKKLKLSPYVAGHVDQSDAILQFVEEIQERR